MLYDIRLSLHYDYDVPVQGGRHLVRVMPLNIAGVQRVIAAALSFDPKPAEEVAFADYFGNSVTTIAFQHPHRHFDVRLSARLSLEDLGPPPDLSPPLAALSGEIAGLWSMAPGSPQHFLSASPRIGLNPAITGYALAAMDESVTVQAGVMALCEAIHRDFTYDPKATDVQTAPHEAFGLRRGVCQDFAQVMIAGLRGAGIPAGYVSGLLRTIPPKGRARLEGADAMHAWVRAWCGRDVGWVQFDPTNAMMAGTDHIAIGIGRDYADISPIVGVLKTSGTQRAKQSVDVTRAD